MKRLVVVAALAVVAMSAFALRKDPAYLDARRSGALARMQIHIVDDLGRDVPDAAIKFSPIFNPRPESITNNVIPLLTRDAHRAQGVPALAPSVGWTGLALYLNTSDTFDEDDQSETATIQRPNGWPIHSDYATRWLHSDMKDVSYFYNFMFYYKLKTKGNIQ